MPFQIVQLQGGPLAGTITYSTLGLGKLPLKAKNSDKIIRHELVMLVRQQAIPGNLPALLQQVAIESVVRSCAYLRGEVIGPRGQLFKESTMTALYATNPVYFPEEFPSVDDPDLGTIVFVWLVPMGDQEAAFINLMGWEEFETKLEKDDPDLLDLRRPSTA